METYTDVDWERSIDDRSTIRAILFFENCLVSWMSKIQSLVSLSTTKEKYITIVACCAQVLWMKQNLKDIHEEFDHPIPIICDNTIVISISNNLVMHSKKKHIPIKYHFLIEQVVEILYIYIILILRNIFLIYS